MIGGGKTDAIKADAIKAGRIVYMAILVYGKKGLREIRRPILSSSFDEYLFLFGEFLFFLLRKGEVQYTVFEACLDVLLGDVLADIEASLH